MAKRRPRRARRSTLEEGTIAEAMPEAAFGRVVKVLRTVQDLGRRELADAAGLSYSYLAEIENGAKPASANAQAALAEALGMPLSALIAEAERLAAASAEPGAGEEQPLREPRAGKRPASPAEKPAHHRLGARERQLRWFQSAPVAAPPASPSSRLAEPSPDERYLREAENSLDTLRRLTEREREVLAERNDTLAHELERVRAEQGKLEQERERLAAEWTELHAERTRLRRLYDQLESIVPELADRLARLSPEQLEELLAVVRGIRSEG